MADVSRVERLRSLVEVIHSVLLSSGGTGGSALAEDWEEIHRGVEARIGPAAAVAGPGSQPSPRVPTEEPADDTMEFFLQSQGGSGSGSAGVSAEGPAADSGFEVEASANRAADAAELLRLREENGALQREMDQLRAAPSGMDSRALLAAWGVTDDIRVSDEQVQARLLEMMEHLARYFSKTRGNLRQIFRGLSLPVSLPEFHDTVLASLDDPKSLTQHLDDLRGCWKTFTGGTWNHLSAWCSKIGEDLSPDAIEAMCARAGGEPWQMYKDVYKRLELYGHLSNYLRTKIKDQLESECPRVVQD